jgi:hypothetical protein
MPLRLKYYPFIFVAVLVIGSCATTNPYKNPQHAVYAKILTPYEKSLINRKGEITKEIELYDPLDRTLWRGMLKGTLRILKTDNPEIFNFVEVGKWVTLSRPSHQLLTNYHARDTAIHDSLGNTLSKVWYYEAAFEKYTLGKKCTAKIIDHQFIQHFEQFIDTSLVREYDMRVIDYRIPRSDSEKLKIMVGTHNDYHEGKLLATRTYDNNGTLIKETKTKH